MKKLNYFIYNSTGKHGEILENGDIDNSKNVQTFKYKILIKYFVQEKFIRIEKIKKYLDDILLPLENKILPVKLSTLEGLSEFIFKNMSKHIDIYEINIFEPDENIGTIFIC